MRGHCVQGRPHSNVGEPKGLSHERKYNPTGMCPQSEMHIRSLKGYVND